MLSHEWLLFIMVLPKQNNTLRMRMWRNLKNLGAAVLRDGVYLLPFREHLQVALAQQAAEIRNINGISWLFVLGEQSSEQTERCQRLFDRGEEYTEFLNHLEHVRNTFSQQEETETRRQFRQIRREWNVLLAIDYFPHSQQSTAKQFLLQVERAINAHFSPQEPQASTQSLQFLDKSDFQHKIWVTRQHLWIDRLASAWLIKRFIDPQAQFLWLDDPKICPKGAIGFDFDGAYFTHTDQYVTFEVLLIRFNLMHEHSLKDLAKVVHYLDVGDTPIAEAVGIEKILNGIRRQTTNDDQMLHESSKVFDYLCYE